MRNHRAALLGGCFAALIVLAASGRAPAKSLLGEPEVDRASDGHDGLWCPAEQIQFYDGTFTADGPEVTLRFLASNHNGGGDWRHERIDNVIVVPLAAHGPTYHFATPALIAAYPCIEMNKNYFHFSEVPAIDLTFLEQFHVPPGPEWDLSDGAYSNPGSSALNSFTLPVDVTGGSLGLGLDANPALQVTTEVTIDGFTAGQQYFVSTWTQCADPTIGSDLVIQVYGTEFFLPTEQQTWDPRPGGGLAWGDFDNDGDNDIYVANANAPNALWLNRSGHFTNVAMAAGVDDSTYGTAVAWGDYDNDGYLDLYLGSAGANRLYRNQCDATFKDVTAGPLGEPQWTASLDWGDYDNDGDLDLFLANDGPDALLRNDGGGHFVDVAAGPVIGIGRPRGCSWVDYDNDRDLDLHVVYSGLPDKLLRNDGGTFVDVTPPILASTELGVSGAWGDYDNDGDLDLFLATIGTSNHLFQNLGGGAFVESTPQPMMDTGPGVEGIWGDYDNDGDLDLYFTKTAANQNNRLYRNDGGGSFSDHITGTVEEPGDARGAGFADADGDGDIDLHLVNAGDDVYFRNEIGDDYHWLHVDLKGTLSNRSGVGAHITVETGGLTQLREVGGETGLQSQNSLTAEFGLGPVALPSDITIEWPSGVVQHVDNVGADQRVTITEANPTSAPIVRDDARFQLEPNHPNPFRGTTSISYSLAEPAELSLRVYDVAGRLVRTLDEGTRSAGTRTVQWNGRDDAGQPVAPGIYFYEMRAGEWARTRKMVRMNED
jgi:hypothetical protein